MRRIKVTVKAVRHSVISRKSIRKRFPKYLFQDIFFLQVVPNLSLIIAKKL